jgi:hypothetical protein
MGASTQGNDIALDAIETFRILDLPLEVREMIYCEYFALVMKMPLINPTYAKPNVFFYAGGSKTFIASQMTISS